jgi:hypothetical protein
MDVYWSTFFLLHVYLVLYRVSYGAQVLSMISHGGFLQYLGMGEYTLSVVCIIYYTPIREGPSNTYSCRVIQSVQYSANNSKFVKIISVISLSASS